MHFSTNFWRKTRSNRGQQHIHGKALPRRDVACARAPAGLSVCTARRPRPPSGRGVPLPHVLRPEAHWSPLGPRARHGPRCTGSMCAAQDHPPAEACPFPMCCAPRLTGVLSGRVRTTDRAVPSRCAPRTAGPSAAPAVRVPAEATVPRLQLRGHALVIAIEPAPI
jgi:hypothetical protein